MIFDDFYKQAKETFERRMALSKKKAEDYATDGDTLHNFKAQAMLTDMKPSQCAAQLVVTKAVRLGNLIFSDKGPANESIEDTILDMQNYLDLMLACREEETRNPTRTCFHCIYQLLLLTPCDELESPCCSCKDESNFRSG